MTCKELPSLRIGNIEANPPIIQGGMGVRVSMSGLASAVANEGCIGVIASVGIDFPKKSDLTLNKQRYVDTGGEAFRAEIRKARQMTKGLIGVNIMYAISNYERFSAIAVEEGVDLIISGAGMPVNLPKFLNGKDVKLVPIVSSARAFRLICEFWKKDYDKLPDAVIVEGVKAGGHLGFSYKEVLNDKAPTLEQIVTEVIEVANTFDPPIPVVAAGGVFDGKDIARFLKLGASGVQMASRFVCTHECDAHENFKKAWINSKKEDITIIKSPVGMPGRVINSEFVQRIKNGETIPFRCTYKCLKNCDPKTIPYCIAEVLTNAVEGNLDEGFAFAGENAYRCNEIVSVNDLIAQLKQETLQYL
ncbi:NAD(P)H-dependent flavin oxidoreductase [Candidatus Magnetobacterium casense]|uniref:Nitronate monooxygenase n=1 Tax=Candidatus Magnetobacterium casense TaxID=1455061 RepID=A0ABS6S3R8_9BACT|nr:nitronate monooxygenase family protein [Candidatus Magnetobacterium casensis]MBV6343497.1 nitronate monooxygenase [Candidatus Magnetobacterium casensis]